MIEIQKYKQNPTDNVVLNIAKSTLNKINTQILKYPKVLKLETIKRNANRLLPFWISGKKNKIQRTGQ